MRLCKGTVDHEEEPMSNPKYVCTNESCGRRGDVGGACPNCGSPMELA